MSLPPSHPGPHRSRRWFVVVIGVMLLMIVAADLCVLFSGRRGIMFSPEGNAPAWIVVPGASVRRDGTPSPVLEERLRKALEAARVWPHARVLLSGTAIPGGYSEPDAMRSWVVSRGLSPDRIVSDRYGTDTRSTIRHLGSPAGDLVIVSQAWHLPRALWSARAAGWNARGLAAVESGLGIRPRLREHVVRVFYFLSPI